MAAKVFDEGKRTVDVSAQALYLFTRLSLAIVSFVWNKNNEASASAFCVPFISRWKGEC